MKRSPLPRKRAGRPRRLLSPRCVVRGCKRIARFIGYCKPHGTEVADKMWSLAVRARDGHCLGAKFFPWVQCKGVLQADHLISRRYHATRHLLAVGATLCLAHHMFVTVHPDRHIDLARALLGAEHYEALLVIARSSDVPDLGEVIEQLRDAA